MYANEFRNILSEYLANLPDNFSIHVRFFINACREFHKYLLRIFHKYFCVLYNENKKFTAALF